MEVQILGIGSVYLVNNCRNVPKLNFSLKQAAVPTGRLAACPNDQPILLNEHEFHSNLTTQNSIKTTFSFAVWAIKGRSDHTDALGGCRRHKVGHQTQEKMST